MVCFILKPELLTQFPAFNDEKELDVPQLAIFYKHNNMFHKQFIQISVAFVFYLKLALTLQALTMH